MSQVDNLYRSFLMNISMGISHGLLEFITEMNETITAVEKEQRMTQELTILKKLRNDAERIYTGDASGRDDAERFARTTLNLSGNNQYLQKETRTKLYNAFEKCVSIDENYINEMTFEEMVRDSGSSDEEVSSAVSDYRYALDTANQNGSKFSAFQINLNDGSSSVVVRNVEQQLKRSGVPCIGFYDTTSNEKAFLHVFNKEDAKKARGMLDNELCRAKICNIQSHDSLQAIANVTRQDIFSVDGLSKAEAGCLYELSMKKNFPVFINNEEQENENSKYTAMVLENGKSYLEKLMAKAIIHSNGYSETAHYDFNSSNRQKERERISDFFNGIYGEKKGGILGYIIDNNLKQEGHRLVIYCDSITEVDRAGKETVLSAKDDPDYYEKSVRCMIDNFAKDFTLIPAEDAERLGISNISFKLNENVRSYIRDQNRYPAEFQKPSQEDIRMANIERSFMDWAVDQSESSQTASQIIAGIQTDLTPLSVSYYQYQMARLDKEYPAILAKEKNPEIAKKILEAKKTSFQKDFDNFFKNKGNILNEHLNIFYNRLEANRFERLEIDRTSYPSPEEEAKEKRVAQMRQDYAAVQNIEKVEITRIKVKEALDSTGKELSPTLPSETIHINKENSLSQHAEKNIDAKSDLLVKKPIVVSAEKIQTQIEKNIVRRTGKAPDNPAVKQHAAKVSAKVAAVQDAINRIEYGTPAYLPSLSNHYYALADDYSVRSFGKHIAELDEHTLLENKVHFVSYVKESAGFKTNHDQKETRPRESQTHETERIDFEQH